MNIFKITGEAGSADLEREYIEQAGEILKKGGLVAFPTETVYGLGADALKEEASGKIYAAKGRPSDNPLIVHIGEKRDLPVVASNISKKAEKLMDTFWPGPLTLVFQKTERVPLGTTGGLNTVAVRMPDHPVALEIIKAGGGFVAAPSANVSGRPSPTMASHVAEDFGERIDMIIDGGSVGIGLESTILDLTEEVPVILRPGYITKEMLEELIGPVKIDPGILQGMTSEVKPKAPGMKYRHYAPKADLSIVQGDIDRVVEEINERIKEKQSQGKKCGVIATEETRSKYKADIVKSIGARCDSERIAHQLYGILREFDQQDLDYIYSESFETEGIGQAIMNRLSKAAAYQVIRL